MSSYGNRFAGRAPSAVDFLRTTAHALPRTLGDRDTIAAMGSAMELAIDTGMQFSVSERETLRGLAIARQVGVFDPFWDGYYRRSCIMGGTYAKVFESQKGFRPWVAPLVYRPSMYVHRHAVYASPSALERTTRVAVGFAVLIPTSAEEDEADLAVVGPDLSFSEDSGPRFMWDQRYAVWYCTSLAADQVILCRYPRGQASPLDRSGTPARRWKLTRADWTEAFAPAGEAAEESPEPARERVTA